MKIDLFGDIHKTHVIEIAGSATELDLVAENAVFDDAVTVKCVVRRDESFTRIEAEISAAATVGCSRCLGEFRKDIIVTFTIVVRHLKQGQVPPEEISDDENDDISEDIVCLPYGEMSIDITDEVRDAVLLEVPFKVICSEDCKGLCATCGVNLNKGDCECKGQTVDNRWQALSGLMGDTDNKS